MTWAYGLIGNSRRGGSWSCAVRKQRSLVTTPASVVSFLKGDVVANSQEPLVGDWIRRCEYRPVTRRGHVLDFFQWQPGGAASAHQHWHHWYWTSGAEGDARTGLDGDSG